MFFFAPSTAFPQAYDIIEDLAEDTVDNGRLRVQYITPDCGNETDFNFDGPENFCNNPE